MITADSSVWIGYFNGTDNAQTRTLDAALDDSANDIVLLDVVLMEVLRGFRDERKWRLAQNLLKPLPVFTAGGESIAWSAAVLYRELRRQGLTVQNPIDLLISAWCIQNDCLLIHNNCDFRGMERLHGLQAAHWE